jgi:PAS domain S-box-containing protein
MDVVAAESESSGAARELSGQGVPDLDQYSLEQVKYDNEFALYRGRLRGAVPTEPSSVLVLAPVSNHPSPSTLQRMQLDHALRSELDPAFVVQSRYALLERSARPMLILEDQGTLPLDCVLRQGMKVEPFLKFAISVSAAVGHVHSRGFVHKDIKPANILVNIACDKAWLVGFGIASRLNREHQEPQPPEVIAGTLAYMAPEQTGRMNRSIDSRSDLYALGMTFYETLTGCLPFTVTDPMEWVHCHIARRPMPPHERNSTIPEVLSTIVMKLLAKTPEERYQTAGGLQGDLMNCLTQWQSKYEIEEFPLGENDTPDRLLIPEKLYGRELAIASMLAAFDRVVAGSGPELVLVSGYSGIGKSSVVHELHKALVPSRGLFASGKFDQHKRDIPYSTFAQAFQGLIRTILTHSEDELTPWRTALNAALGPNGGLIVNLVPDLQLIIGEPPPVPEIPRQEAQRRFQLVMRRFIGVFARAGRPLALFLDDLQWLDAESHDLMSDLLAQSDLPHLIVIGAYRDNEVDASHPLIQKLSDMRVTGSRLTEIVLAPLTTRDFTELVADTLHCGHEHAEALAVHIHEGTAGNPLFAIQFMSEFVEEGLIAFDYKSGKWDWDLQSIRAKRLAENVVELLVGKLSRLPDRTEGMLKLMACIGHSAEVNWLGMASRQSIGEVDSQLLEAVQAGLVNRSEGSYEFIHDRIQEAAYSLVPADARAAEHLRIGRLLAKHAKSETSEAAIFDIVNQFCRGAGVISSAVERREVAALCLTAATRAKMASAYASALVYLAAGANFLADQAWSDCRDLWFNLELNRAECEFLTGRPLDAQRRIAALEGCAGNGVEEAAIACLHIDVCTTLNQTSRAVDVALKFLDRVDFRCSPHPSEDDVKNEYDRIRKTLGLREIRDILSEPLLTDADILATHDVLTRAIPPAAFIDINLASLMICRAVNLSLERGSGDGSCFSYVMLAQLAGPRFGDHALGFEFGQLGYELVEKRGLRRFQACTYVAYAIYTGRWVKNERFALSVIRRAFEVANSNAEQNFATLCWPVITASLLFTGEPIQDAQANAERGLALAKSAQFDFAADMILPQLALIKMLRGAGGSFGSLDSYIGEPEFVSRVCGNPAFVLAEGKYWVRKLQACFFAGNYTLAVKAAEKAHLAAVTAPGAEEHSEYHFYGALAHAACCRTDNIVDHPEHREVLTRHLAQLKSWSSHSPEDYENRALLAEAELARIDGRLLNAEQLFERAISSCRDNGFVHNQAIANERAAHFYAQRGLETIARAYLQGAHSCYLRWGATGKANHLTIREPWLRHQDRESSVARTIDASVEHLDLATVVKVLQAVAGEIVLDRLIETLMRTAMEHSGANRGLLILATAVGSRIAAEAAIGDTIVINLRDEAVGEMALPQAVLHIVSRTQADVILDDASALMPFSVDPYVCKYGTRSVLCMPLLSRGQLVGILYLENGLAPGVFAASRVSVLKLLASQAAISLENTRLYRDLAEREAKIRHLVDANIVGIEIVDLNGVILEANDAFLRIVGYDREDLDSGRLKWTELTATQYQGRDRQDLLVELLRSEKLHPFEWEYIRKDGSHVSVLSGAATFDNGKRAVGFVLDLTERKRVEQALRQSEAYLAEAQRMTNTGSWAYNYGLGRYTYYSDEQFRIYGHEPRPGNPPELNEITGRFHPEDRPRLSELIERIVREKSEYAVDFRIRMPDGTVRHLSSTGHPVIGEKGELLEHYGTVVDVTERRRSEQRLLVQHRVARILAEADTAETAIPEILQSVGDCLGYCVGTFWKIDRNANLLFCTASWHAPAIEISEFEEAARIRRLEPGASLAGRVWVSRTAACIPDILQDSRFDRNDVAAREGLRTAFAFPIMLESEVQGVIELASRDVWQSDGELLETMTAIGRQIGQFVERKRAEDELQRAQSELAYATRVITMGELAASIAHEVNQPLGAMVTSAGSCAQWLAATPPDMAKARRALERIVNDGRRAGDVIKRIRTLMKRQIPRKTLLQVNEAIREVIALTHHELRRKEILLEAELSEGLPPVQGDRVQLQQVLLNLIVNAIEAMSSMDAGPRHLTIASWTEGSEFLQIEVRDSGPGLSRDHAVHLFEPFYTTKTDGIGIGLSISRSIVEAHGGQLTAQPNYPHGAVFRLSLPV